MKTKELKMDLYKLIEQINDNSVLEALKILLKNKIYNDFEEEVPEYLMELFNESLIQSHHDELLEHSDVIREAKEKYL